MGEKDLSLSARVEVTKKYARVYADASKRGKGLILDQVVGVTGWNRDHAPDDQHAEPSLTASFTTR